MSYNNIRLLTFLWIGFISIYGIYGYSYFDDYLSSLNEDQQKEIIHDPQELEGSGSDSDFTPVTMSKLPLRSGLTGNKDVACCSLGHLAGDKGYHCIAKFYAARIMIRNQNRAHNGKLGFYGLYSIPNYGTKLMRTFEQCVATRRQVFHKCCQHAAIGRGIKPHYDSQQRKRYENKMRRIRIPRMQDNSQ